MADSPFSQPDDSFDALLAQAVRRLLGGEALEPFCTWFAAEMGALVLARHPIDPADEDGARRYQRSVARTLWAALPVPSNRWRPRQLPKLERNDPCHCGSGRKYKQCCSEFAQLAPPMGSESLYALALAHADAAMLTPGQLRLVPGEALGTAALEWNERGETQRTIEILTPLFEACEGLDGRHEAAFDALMDAMLAHGMQRERRGLAQRIGRCKDKTLAVTARCREASLIADEGDFDAAWSLFQSAQRLDPSDPQLLHLELTLLLLQGRTDEAKLRAPVLAAKARRAAYDDLAGVLLELGESGLAALRDPQEDEVDLPEDLAWIALCEQAPDHIDAPACRELYRIGQTPSSPDEQQLPVLSIKPGKALADLHRRWARRFPVEQPLLTQLEGDAGFLLDELPAAADFLRRSPRGWLCAQILDDLLLAGAQLCDWDAPAPILRATHRLAEHALNVLRALAGPTGADVPAQLHWTDPHARPLLRILAQSIRIAAIRQDAVSEESLIGWSLALNPEDNHGWRSSLVSLYLNQDRFDEALALLDRYPDDLPPAEHSRAVALFALGRRDDAQAALRAAHEAYPDILKGLLPEVLDPPEDEGGPGMRIGGATAAFGYRHETRAVWIRTGALAWAERLQLPDPVRTRARKRAPGRKSGSADSVPAGGVRKTAGKGPGAQWSYGAKQESHLRKTFSDYPRLHGLLTAIAWSPDLVMPDKWLTLVQDMRIQPPSAATPGRAIDAINADLAALMALLNTKNAQVLETPVTQQAPIQDVLALAASNEDAFAWAAGFVQGSELVGAGWRRAGRPVNSERGAFASLYALAARAPGAPAAWRATRDSGQPLLVGLEEGRAQPVETLELALSDLWRVIAPMRQARNHAGGGS